MPHRSSWTATSGRGEAIGRRSGSGGGASATVRLPNAPAALGNALRARGVQIEQRVLLALPDSPAFAEAFWGAVKLGAVAVPVSDTLEATDYGFLLNDTRARVAIVGEAVAPKVLSVRASCPWLSAVVVAGARAARRRGLRAMARALVARSGRRRHRPRRRRDVGVHLRIDGAAQGGHPSAPRPRGVGRAGGPRDLRRRRRRPRVLGVEALLRLRPRQLAAVSVARGRRRAPRAGAPGAPRACSS